MKRKRQIRTVSLTSGPINSRGSLIEPVSMSIHSSLLHRSGQGFKSLLCPVALVGNLFPPLPLISHLSAGLGSSLISILYLKLQAHTQSEQTSYHYHTTALHQPINSSIHTRIDYHSTPNGTKPLHPINIPQFQFDINNMCRQYYTLYEWCQCEEDAGNSVCAGVRRSSCPGVSVETVHMQCFCNSHATRGFKSEKQTRKAENKTRRRSQESLDEKASFGRRWYQWYQWRGLRSR